MSRLTLRLPDSLHRQLKAAARKENVSLNQFIVYALTRQMSSYEIEEVPADEVKRQEESFYWLLEQLNVGTDEDIRRALEAREPAESEEVMAWPQVQQLRERVHAKLANPSLSESRLDPEAIS
ncbi:MAG: toxin-antitoxin system HicB family antitoxin [Chloroflexi bacterium]|nr:toxin-antitoxin system HicB family antitoxin [Chloroflexota bacterium]